MNAGLVNLFWVSLMLSLGIAFFAAYPSTATCSSATRDTL
jgi:hypothetical protein